MRSLTTFPKQNPKIFDPDLYGTDPREQVAASSSYQGAIGIEIEVEGENLPPGGCPAASRASWIYHNDGSLRAVGGGAPGGAEYVLSEPIDEDFVPTAVGNLMTFLRNSGSRIVNSTRCSTHVHLNMQGIKLNQLASFVVLWGTLEDALSLWCGEHRAGNHFALRLSDCDEAVNRWVLGFKHGNFHFDHERRYLALNPACLQTFGSLEVRMLGGIENEQEVITWISWLQRIKKAALSARFQNPESIAGIFSGVSYDDFARDILGSDAVDALIRACEASGQNFNKLIVQGFRRVQSICYALPWGVVIAECNKPFVPNPFAPVRKRKGNFPLPGRLVRAARRAEEDEDFGMEDEG